MRIFCGFSVLYKKRSAAHCKVYVLIIRLYRYVKGNFIAYLKIVDKKCRPVLQKRQNISVFGNFARPLVIVYRSNRIVLHNHFNLICIRPRRGFAPFGVIHNNSVQIVVFVDMLNLHAFAVRRSNRHISVDIIKKHIFVVRLNKNRIGGAVFCVRCKLFAVPYFNSHTAALALFGA